MLIGILSVISVIACASTAAETDADVRSAIERKTEEMETYANAGDVETLLRNFYNESPIIAYGAAHPARNVAEARVAWREILKGGKIEFTTDAIERSRDMVAQMGRWKLRVSPEEGDFREEEGRFFIVWKKRGDSWRVVMQQVAPEGFHEVD